MPSIEERTGRTGTPSYRVRFRLHGRPISRSFPTRRAATVFLTDLTNHGPEYAVRLADDTATHQAAPTLDAVFEEYLTWKTRRVRSDRTTHDYRRDYTNHIQPALGHYPVTLLTVREVRAWVDQLADPARQPRALSPKTVAGYHALLHSIIRYAMDPARAYLTTDPCINPELPKRPRKPPRGLHPDTWALLFAHLTEQNPDAADLAHFLVASGWRFSEAAALAPTAVSTRGDHVVVTMQQVARRGADHRNRIIDDGKSSAAFRATTLDATTGAMVRARAAAARGGLVFTNSLGRPWVYASFWRAWDKALRAAGIKAEGVAHVPTVHELRHTHIGWLLQTPGVTVTEVQRRAGHASQAQTLAYASMVQDVPPAALSIFEATYR